MSCYPLGGPYEVDSVVVVLLHTCGNGEHVRIEDDIKRVHPHLIHQYMVSPLGYLYSALKGCGLSYLVEAHHHTGGSVSEHILGMSDKHFLALLERYGVDDTLALTTLQSGSDDIPLDESIMIGTLAISGSAAIILRKFTISALASSSPSSILTSTTAAPSATCLRAIPRASS